MFRITEAEDIRQNLDKNQCIKNGIIARFNESQEFFAFLRHEAEKMSYGCDEYSKIDGYPCAQKLATIAEIVYDIQSDKSTSREIVTDQILSNLIYGLQGYSDQEITDVVCALGAIYDVEL